MSRSARIVVVGGGHAGVEAAHAAARIGADVTIVTLRCDAVVRLSCNPAIGGIGKGHLVREVDAMGGLMGIAADLAGIHFRVLNKSRGPAVQGPRVQQDHGRYPVVVSSMLEQHPRISIVEGEARELVLRRGRVVAVRTAEGLELPADAVVVTTGTFLRGRLFQGEDEVEGGRTGEPASVALSGQLSASGLRLGRFKTGTPPRLVAESIESGAFEPQPGDRRPEPLSFAHLAENRFTPQLAQTVTHIAHTNEKSHEIVRSGLDRSPLFSGRVLAKGPRYCPSFEDKVVKFPDRDRHLLHLEPMGLDHPWIYVNGLSTSLPADLQDQLVRSIRGLERARIARHGYAVEYDFVPPTQLRPTLETRAVRGLFLAGQICGTTGYEEAAALGLVAGANAALSARGHSPFVPNRLTSYLGVMVDDLTTRGVVEPYRMFTSRAEMRLSLSADTADRRLTPVAARLGMVSPEQAERARERWRTIEAGLGALEGAGRLRDTRRESPADRIRRGAEASRVLADHLPQASRWPDRDVATLLSRIRYRGYLEREQRELERLRRAEAVQIPPEFEFVGIPGLSHEVVERLEEVRPSSVGQASRIPGVTPAAIALLAAAAAAGQRGASV